AGICCALAGNLQGAAVHLKNGIALRDDGPATPQLIEALGCLALVDYFAGSPSGPRSHIDRAWARAEGTELAAGTAAAPLLLVDCMLAVDELRLDDADHCLSDLAIRIQGSSPYELLYRHVSAIVRGLRHGPLEQLDALQEIQIRLRD